MICTRWARRCAAVLLAGWVLCGCLPGGDSRGDEEREPHFLMGRKLASQLDYQGAGEEYEKALTVNPQSASAHFELAVLYEDTDKLNDPAAAIYHYSRFLKLAPDSGKADVARAHINSCKLELAKSASALAPMSASAQKDLDRLVQENKDLKAQVAQWKAYYASVQAAQVSNRPPPAGSNIPAGGAGAATNGPVRGRDAAVTADNRPANSTAGKGTRMYRVVSGDTFASIARRSGVSLKALQSANAQYEATKLKPGTMLVIPAP